MGWERMGWDVVGWGGMGWGSIGHLLFLAPSDSRYGACAAPMMRTIASASSMDLKHIPNSASTVLDRASTVVAPFRKSPNDRVVEEAPSMKSATWTSMC